MISRLKTTMPKNVLCCYCGVNKATTKDHIPPKSIFNKPRPSNLVTVPSCFACNNSASSIDEKFKTYLGLHVAKEGGEAERLFKEGVLSTTRHNKSLKETIINSMQNIRDANDAKTEYVSILWDSEAHDITIERMVRGLFYHHFGKVISDKAKVNVYWLDKEHTLFDDQLNCESIGNGPFKYRYGKAEDDEFASIWLFTFYDSHFAGGMVLP